jgi:hypothetical protein
MPVYYHSEARRGGIKVQRVDIMEYIDQCWARFRHGRFTQRIRPVPMVRIAPYGDHWRQGLQSIEDFLPANVSRMDNQLGSAQSFESLRAQKSMCVGDDAN